MKKSPEISVIIPALNEEKYINSVFNGLKNQTFRDFEVILVDGKSSDRTRDIAKKYAKVIIEPRPNIGLARNTGARHAKGEILLFTDADSMPSKNLLMVYHKVFKYKNVVAATGPLTPLEKTSDFLRFGFTFATITLAKMFSGMGGSNFAVRKSAFVRCGGFDESLATYEDIDLAKRLARYGRVKFVDSAHIAVSARRVMKWGIVRFVMFNVENIIMYTFFKKPAQNYEQIR